jgi:hypothetical protein
VVRVTDNGVEHAHAQVSSLCAHVLHVCLGTELPIWRESARSRSKIFFPCNRFFLQKDVAESVEARKVTPSFLTVERKSMIDVGHRSSEIQLPMTVGEPWPVASKASL